ncbi:hypothetical protein [Kribbella sp. NPDC051770]|uniref:Y-family DNA polymerase n=1 Tax=Kribbella sp. NPDC051770 TaxID=3155413 RepID=UPI0034134BC9
MGVRTMVVWVPDWPVLAAASGEGVSAEEPVAVLSKGRVLASSASARAQGVRRGLRARDAQSRCPELLVLKYDPVIDARAFDPVISCLEALTPGTQVIRPGMCALKARGPSRFYGSEPAAAEKLLDRLETYDVPGGRVGIADGPFAAEQAARAASAQTRVRVIPPGGSAEFLAPLTVDTLERPELTDLLRRLGLRSLGAFAQLPPTEVLTRFGPDGAFAHRLARGDDDRAVVAREVPPELIRTLDFEPPVDRVDQVAFAVRTVADELVARLTALGLVCTTLRLEVGTDSGRVHEREWLHPRWFAPTDIVDRVRWQLQGSGTADLTSPVTRLRLIPERVDPVGAHADTLWGTGPDERIHRALSRVQSMLGHGAVVTPVITGGRSYKDRQSHIPWGDPLIPVRDPTSPWPGALPGQPNLPTPEPEPSPTRSTITLLRPPTVHLVPPPEDTTPLPQPAPTPAALTSVPPTNAAPARPASVTLTTALPAATTPARPASATTTLASVVPADTALTSVAPASAGPVQLVPALAVLASDEPAPAASNEAAPVQLVPARGALGVATGGAPAVAPAEISSAPADAVFGSAAEGWSGEAAEVVSGKVGLGSAGDVDGGASWYDEEELFRRPPPTWTPLALGGTSGWPVPVPALVYPVPHAVEVLAGDGRPVTVSARGALSGVPSVFRWVAGAQVADSNKLYPVTAWAGPWPVDERWWDAEAENRLARFQLVTADGRAWLAAVRNTQWWIEASYD